MSSKDNIYPGERMLGLPHTPSLERLLPPVEDASRLLVSCIPAHYSASRIARAVEDCDAHLLNLNVTSDGRDLDNRVVVELRVSHRDPSSVARSIERYGYEVMDMEGGLINPDSALDSRLAELLHYLEI